MRRRDVLVLGASLVGALAARGALTQPRPSLARAAVVIGVDRAGDLTPLRAAVSGAREFADWLEAEEFEVKRFFDDGGPVAVGDIKTAVKELVGRGCPRTAGQACSPTVVSGVSSPRLLLTVGR